MISIFVLNGLVIGRAASHQTGAFVKSTIANAITCEVGDDSPVDTGWACVMVDDLPVFTAPAALLPMLTPMTLYMAFTPAERIVIKESTDPMVKEFWAMYELSVQLEKNTDPNLSSVQNALEYLAAPASPGKGAGILSSRDRIPQILAGVPQ